MANNNLFAPFGARPTETRPPPQSTGNFQAHEELGDPNIDEGGRHIRYQSISSMQQHKDYSFEELRLNDIMRGRGIVERPATDKHIFGPNANGLAFARVPGYGWPSQTSNTSCRTLAANTVQLGSAIVTFKVGKEHPDARDFVVHENVVSQRSEFVRLSLSKDWKEAHERVIRLPDDLPETFELYQQWLYTNKIPSDHFGKGQQDCQEYKVLVRAYLLGERFMDSHFKDAIIDCIIHKLRKSSFFDPRLTTLIYENTLPHSPLRRLWQDIYFWAGNPDWFDEKTLGDFIHAEFSIDFNRYQMRMNMGSGTIGPPYVSWPCSYHEHAGEVCYRGLIGRQ